MERGVGYQLKACPDSFAGISMRAMEEEVLKKVDTYVTMLLQSAEKYEDEGIRFEVKITAGFPIRQVVLQEVLACNPSWVILDRHLRRDLRFYHRHIPCKVALIHDSLSLEILRPYAITEADTIEQKVFFSKSERVPPLDIQGLQTSINCKSFSMTSNSMESPDVLKSIPSTSTTNRQFELSKNTGSSSKKEKSDTSSKGENMYESASQIVQTQNKGAVRQKSLESAILCSSCGTRNELYIKDSMRFSYSELVLATTDFSKENLLGEGGYGHVYKGELKDGQFIAAKVRKEASSQGFAEFHSEVLVLSFARHKNIVMLLGYCCKENLNILVYEYVCNKSLDWHLFDQRENVLELHQRYAIALGTAKGLRFLHEECRGGPIIHRDVRPSNILLTHDFVPMLGDFGLAKWKMRDDPLYTRILGTFGYLAPEYAENGILSVRTDVYAFGIVLLQLISGRKVLDTKGEEKQQSLRQWAEPLIENLALHELIDPRLGKTYDTYELYLMARTAYLCVQRNPENRPSMGEVVRLLEGDNDHFHYLGEQLIPHYTK